MTILQRVWAWLVFSSKDPNKLSLTLKAGLTGVVAAASIVAGIGGVDLPVDDLSEVINAVVAFIQSTVLWVSSALTAWGIIRKVWTTITSDNRVVNEHPAFK